MTIDGRKLNLSEFEKYVSAYDFGKIRPSSLV